MVGILWHSYSASNLPAALVQQPPVKTCSVGLKCCCRVSQGTTARRGALRLRAATADAASVPHSVQPEELVRLGPMSVTAKEVNRLWVPALAAYFLHANLDGKGDFRSFSNS